MRAKTNIKVTFAPKGTIKTPPIHDATVPVYSHHANEALKQELNYPNSPPGELVDNWKTIALNKLKQLVESNRGLKVFMDSCMRCGACSDKCHYFLGSGDAKNMPIARQELMRRVYRRYFTFWGRLLPKWVGAVELTEEILYDWYNYFHQCSECRRCAIYCPIGIDTAEITIAGRQICAEVGLVQKYSNTVINNVQKTGNNLGMPKPALIDTLQDLEQDLYDDTGIHIPIPLDQPDADILLITPSADFFAEPHVDGLLGYSKILHQGNVRWTLSSDASEAANFALFTGSQSQMRLIGQRIIDAAKQLNARKIVIGECGHAWRFAYNFLPQWFDLSFLDTPYPLHICEITYDLLTQNKIRLDRQKNQGKIITFHDSCNVARASSMGDKPGGQFDIPRALLKAATVNFIDMHATTIREQSFCCGGGGGLLTDELINVREQGLTPRLGALQAVIEQHGVTHMAAICAICKTQFSQLLPQHHFDREMIVSLHQVVGDALIIK